MTHDGAGFGIEIWARCVMCGCANAAGVYEAPTSHELWCDPCANVASVRQLVLGVRAA